MVAQILGLAIATFSTGLDVWLGFGRVASQVDRYLHIYGGIGIVLPFLTNSHVFHLVEDVLWESDDDAAIRFLNNQLQQIALVAATASVVAGVAGSGLNFKFLSAAHWTAKVFMLTSLLSGLFCVYYSMKQLRILSKLITPGHVRDWLRSPPERIQCQQKNRPSIRAVLVLDTPRSLLAIAAVSYIVGLSIYLVSVYISNLDPDARQTYERNVVIAYFIVLWFCLALYTKADLFDWYKDRSRTWIAVVLMVITVKQLLWHRTPRHCEHERPAYAGNGSFPPLHQSSPHQSPGIRDGYSYKTDDSLGQDKGVDSSVTLRDSQSSRLSQEESQRFTGLMDALEETVANRQKCLESEQVLLATLKAFT